MVLIPFSVIPPKILTKISDHFIGLGNYFAKLMPHLQLQIERAGFEIDTKRYLAMCFTANSILFLLLSTLLTIIFIKIDRNFLGVGLAFIFSLIILVLQINYPVIFSRKRIRKLDTDLLAALRAIMIQLNSGIPLFEATVIISQQQFGEISKEFSWAVKRINAGVPQIEVFENMAIKNPSPYFRRALWQMINGLKEGATINKVIDYVIESLTKEQIIQIEKYGAQLNPLAMFYMMVAVIIPALGVTLMIVLASFIQFEELLLQLMFGGLLGGVIFFQIMFLGIIKSKRPSLLGE